MSATVETTLPKAIDLIQIDGVPLFVGQFIQIDGVIYKIRNFLPGCKFCDIFDVLQEISLIEKNRNITSLYITATVYWVTENFFNKSKIGNLKIIGISDMTDEKFYNKVEKKIVKELENFDFSLLKERN